MENCKHEWRHTFKDYGDCFYVIRHCYGCGANEEASGSELRWYNLGPMTTRATPSTPTSETK